METALTLDVARGVVIRRSNVKRFVQVPGWILVMLCHVMATIFIAVML